MKLHIEASMGTHKEPYVMPLRWFKVWWFKLPEGETYTGFRTKHFITQAKFSWMWR